MRAKLVNEEFKLHSDPIKDMGIGRIIKVEDVMNWADENETDPIIDGPIYISEKDEKEFMKSLPKKFVETGDLFNGWNLSSLKYETESDNRELVKLWVNFLNKKGYNNDYI